MRTKTKKSIKKQLDETWKEIIHQKNRCEVCGSTYGLNAHHIIGRGNLNLRWDIRNGCLLCIRHHKFGLFSAHENPIYFMNWLKNHRPDDYIYLKNPDFTKTKTWRISDYEQILERLNEIQKAL